MTFDEEFQIVKRHTILLAYEWLYYKELFNEKESRKLLAESASNFFITLQMMYIDSIILKISRLLESQKKGSNSNLTIDYLIKHITLEEKDLIKLNDMYQKAKVFFDELKPYRNKSIAHIDMNTALNEINHLPPKVQKLIEIIISFIFQIMNIIEIAFKGSSTAYEHVISTDGASTLLFQLDRAQKYKQLVKEKKLMNLKV